MKRTLWALAFAVIATGCDVEEKLAPLGGPSDAGTDAGDDAGTGGKIRRTVMTRNPFGNVAETENLLWDGDFEWYSPFGDEYGWLSGPPFNYGIPGTQMGSACRSGIKCAEVPGYTGIVAIGVGLRDKALYASMWAKPPSGKCTDAFVVVGSLSSNLSSDVHLDPVSDKAQKDGWCHYEVTMPPQTDKPVLYLRNIAADTMLVDDCVLKAAPEEKKGARAADAAGRAEMDAVRKDLRRLRGPHDSPPNPARRAFEEGARRTR